MQAFRKLVKKEVRRASGTLYTKRVYYKATSLTASSTVTLSLLACDDDPNYDQVSDGTTPAEVAPGAKIMKVDLSLQYYNSTGAGNTFEWLLYRDKDNENSASFTPANLWTSDYSPSNELVKRDTLNYGHALIPSTFQTVKSRVFIKRKALARAGTFKDGDRLEMALVLPAGTTQNANVIGRIWVRED